MHECGSIWFARTKISVVHKTCYSSEPNEKGWPCRQSSHENLGGRPCLGFIPSVEMS